MLSSDYRSGDDTRPDARHCGAGQGTLQSDPIAHPAAVPARRTDQPTTRRPTRILLAAGILERAEPRHGPTGALEKPYRSTGQSWTLDIGTDNADASVAMVDAFRAELTEAGPESIKSSSRFVLHLDDATRDELLERIQALLDEYEATDDERRAEHQPRFGGLFVIHELASSE